MGELSVSFEGTAMSPLMTAPPARRFVAWVLVGKCWQRVGTAATEVAALVLAAGYLRRRRLTGGCYVLPIDRRPEQRGG